jgi:hypothetical protein
MNNVTKSSAYSIEGSPKRGRPRLHPSAAAKQAAYRERKHPARIEPGTRVTFGTRQGIVTSVHGDRFIVAFQSPTGREWRDLTAAELTFAGRVSKLPAWTDSGRPLSKNWKPWRLWQTGLPPTEMHTAEDGEKVAVPVYARRTAGRRKTRRDYTKLIDHNLAVLMGRAKQK